MHRKRNTPVTCRHVHFIHTYNHNCFLNKLMGIGKPLGNLAEITDITMKAPLECKVMNNVSTLSVFCVVKFSCSEMEEKKGFRLVFWGAHPPHILQPLVFQHLPQVPYFLQCFPPHTTPLLPLFLPFSPLSLSQYTVSGLVYMARGKQGRGIV